MADKPKGPMAKVPVGELTLREAEASVDDPSFFYQTMPPVVYHFQHCLTVDAYWELRVDDHNLLVAFLEREGHLGDA